MVEHAGSSSRFNSKGNKKDKRKNDKKSKGKSEYLAPKAEIVKQKFQGTCYNCDKPGHRTANCNMPKRVNPHQANMVNDDVDMIAMVSHVCAMIFEVNLVEQLTMDRSCIWAILHALIQRAKNDNQMYVGKGYAMNGIFKLNVMVVKNEINKMNSSAYLIESSNVWHARLRHVNFNSMRHLIKFNSIPNCHIVLILNFEACVKAKLTRTSFKSVKRKTEPLDMIHTDICDLKSLPTKGDNKVFITFIDDCTKYCYVYLLKSKYEAIEK
ncbi:pol polyprotein [Tanacetum coccineum]|uniref:Pol polyprotein n=1 Tax=Tanacetum coccineum TaxID=301880 RepID=A0ABQ4YQF4_9ASTR